MESKWVGEIAENCQGVKLVLVALKCDLREKHSDEDDDAAGESDAGHPRKEKEMIDYKQGLEVARRIQALRYLGMVGRLFITDWKHAKADDRMFGQAESRCQRGVHRSCPGCAFGQVFGHFRRRKQMLCDVSCWAFHLLLDFQYVHTGPAYVLIQRFFIDD